VKKDAKARILTIAVLAGIVGLAVADQGGFDFSEPAQSAASILKPKRKKAEDPKDVLFRMLDAARDGDVETYIDCHSGDMARRLAQSRDEMTSEGFSNYLKARNEKVKGIAIDEPEQASDTEVRVRVEWVYQDRNEAQQFYLAKTGDEWKIRDVEATVRVETPAPYGMPVY